MVSGSVMEQHGGIGASRLQITYCKFGEKHCKPTFLWTNIDSIIDELDETRGPNRKTCTAKHPCGNLHHEQICKTVQAKKASPFPIALVHWLCMHIQDACASRRTDGVPPF